MIRNETFIDGVCVSAVAIDPDAGTAQDETNGELGPIRPATEAELAPILAQRDRDARAAARASALAKLAALGLTETEATALLGGG